MYKTYIACTEKCNFTHFRSKRPKKRTFNILYFIQTMHHDRAHKGRLYEGYSLSF